MPRPKYNLNAQGEFVIENYSAAPAFSSFLPGIAGVFGCPLWVFYANRGQGVTSFGVGDKDGAIMEFYPADQAYRAAARQGFRTFIKVNGKFYEPFRGASPNRQAIKIAPHGLKIEETNPQLKVKVEVEYFTVPNESFPALARILKITNLSARPQKIEALDGLPVLVPHGFTDDLLKKTSHTTAAWCKVENLKGGAPFYRLKVAPTDTAEVAKIEAGNFFSAPAGLIVEPKIIFGENSGLDEPVNFVMQNKFRIPPDQITEGILPCAFAHKTARLPGKAVFELHSVFGHIESPEKLNAVKRKFSSGAYIKEKSLENQALISDITAMMGTESSANRFNLYCRQTFLDNVMRGGLPVTWGDKILYLYYRKHGDMERDYNEFKLMPAYLSQGNGNYRDTNQNRRSDVFFNPAAGADNITHFFNLIQLDGYNPLILQPTRFTAPDHPEPFMLGEYLLELERRGHKFNPSREEFVSRLLANATPVENAVHGEGFWIDHFTYNTDLLESFENIFPEKTADLLFNNRQFTFYDNEYVVAERSEKYRLSGGKVRQYGSVRLDPEKSEAIRRRKENKNLVRVNFGKGEVYKTTLIAKLLCLIANKAASFDAEGIGLEMEAEKPGWYDALNGLPGLLGSSLSETLELKRLCAFVLCRLPADLSVQLPMEVKELLEGVTAALTTLNGMDYWEAAYQAKENFRRKTKLGVDGKEAAVEGKAAAAFLQAVINKCDRGVKKCLTKYKNYYTYFINEVVEYDMLDGAVKVKKFSQRPLPLFLEGFVHALKVEQDANIPALVKQSPLYDKKLKMCKVNAPLDAAPVEIGRAKIFAPGWLENESVWLHMEYKYLLELLKAGLYREFFADFKNALIPFLNPKTYGRSILENSSFIASSAHADRKMHGRGFYARLSGASAEFIDMWLILTTGKKIFSLDQSGQLVFRLAPVLPGWLFKNGKFRFKLLGSIDATYLNPKGKDTFEGMKIKHYKLVLNGGKEIEINADSINEPYASLIRERKAAKIVVTLA